MWPTSITPFLLAAGVLTVGLVLWGGLRRGIKGLASLRVIGVAVFWMGYQLSPLSSYFTGRIWDHFLLVPDEINAGLLFSLLCMWGYLFAYDLAARSHRAFPKRRFSGFELPSPSPMLLYTLTLIAAGGFIVNIGGFDQIWHASYARGQGQFAVRNLEGRLRQMIIVVSNSLDLITATAGALAVLGERSRPRNKIAGWLALAASDLSFCHGFSRAAGLPFVVVGVLAPLIRRKHGFRVAFLCALAAGYLGWVGYAQRGSYTPGLGTFSEAALPSNLLTASAAMTKQKSPQFNLLDAMPAWTRVALDKSGTTGDGFSLALNWLSRLSPIPSQILPLAHVGTNLSATMGTWGKVGITTPTFAEIYYVFGVWGFLLMLPFGALFAFFDSLPRRMPGIVAYACWLLAMISLVTTLTGTTRAMTRPLLYALVLYVANRLYESHRRAELAMIPMHPLRQAERPAGIGGGDPRFRPSNHI